MAALYRLPPAQTFQPYFQFGWRGAYTHIAKLMGPTCHGSKAYVLVGKLLSEENTRGKKRPWARFVVVFRRLAMP